MGGRSLMWAAASLCAVAILSACGSSGSSAPSENALSAQAQLGEKIFADVSLSASGAQACSTCHDPDHAHSPANALAVQLGGPLSDQQGIRKTPGIRYLATNTAFFFDREGTPTGGFFWDGRAASPAVQAAEPFLNPFELANPDKASVVAKLAAATYAAEFKAVYGAGIFSDVEGAYQRMTLAIQSYEKEDSEFNAYTSKYDAFLRGSATLTAEELRGLAFFNSPTKGNCAGCHPSAKGADGSLPLFTDFTYDNLTRAESRISFSHAPCPAHCLKLRPSPLERCGRNKHKPLEEFHDPKPPAGVPPQIPGRRESCTADNKRLCADPRGGIGT